MINVSIISFSFLTVKQILIPFSSLIVASGIFLKIVNSSDDKISKNGTKLKIVLTNIEKLLFPGIILFFNFLIKRKLKFSKYVFNSFVLSQLNFF